MDLRRIVASRWVRWGAMVVLAGVCVGIGMWVSRCDRDTVPEIKPRPLSTSETPPYAKYLKDVRICLDPGHGGRANQAGYKRGPTGLREAEVNLRVALFLREFLEASGAKVFMTRTKDVYLHKDESRDLRMRAEVANRNDCDVFLSIHHNAAARETANFSSVWYHADVDHSPASLDIARHISVALIDELALPEVVGCPLMSDYQMYPNGGFAVLRYARVPAVLSEASFHSNREEEQRLRDPEYNRQEAKALFWALARYAQGGIPKARLVEPPDGIVSPRGSKEVVIKLDDGVTPRGTGGCGRQLVLLNSIVVRWDGKDVPFTFDEESSCLTVRLPSNVPAGPIKLFVQFENAFKHSNTRPMVELRT